MELNFTPRKSLNKNRKIESEVSSNLVDVDEGYDMGFSLCIYLIPLLSLAYVFRLMCHHAYDPVKSATTSEII